MDAERRSNPSINGSNRLSFFHISLNRALVAAVLALTACSASDSGDSPGRSGQPPSAGTGGAPPDDLNVEIAFEPKDAVPLAPREEHVVTVVVTPPAAHTVRFALIDARDAALDQSTRVTDVTGRGSVTLTAPSTLGEFSLRAQVGSRSAVLDFTVTPRASADVEVVPRYAGRRPVTEWTASVHIGPRCADLGPLPKDSPRLFARIAADKTATIPDVWLGSPIAVTVRAAQFAAGCTDVSADESRESIRVEVPVVDRPLALASTALDLSLGVGPHDATFASAIERGLTAVRSEFLGGETRASTALLDAMDAELKTALRPAFRAARTELDWDAQLAQRAGLNQLTERIGAWVAVGQSSLLSQRAFEGHLSADPLDPSGKPVLRLERIAELAASAVSAEVTTTGWSADASDTLAFTGQITWKHGELVAALAEAPARAGAGVTDLPAALAAIADCGGVATSLLSMDGAAALEAVCNAACLASACRAALTTMWERAAAGGGTASLSIAAAGAATIGNQAQATALEGNWVGKLTLDAVVGDTTGAVVGAAPRYTAR